ncbi:MAG: nitronate monooxygenase [Pseudoxanthomonas sp.]
MRQQRIQAFCERFGLGMPVLLAPMAGACPVALSVAAAGAGSMGAMGAVLSQPADITAWVNQFRAQADGPTQVNLWVPDPEPVRDAAAEAAVRDFLGRWGPAVPADAGDARPAAFDAQFQAVLQARPQVLSTIMGVLDATQVQALREAGIAWFATATTLAEARQAQAAGADAVIAQGFEAGGHRGAFDAAAADRQMTGLLALVPRLADALEVPVIAAGGIGDGRGIAAALTLGASAAVIGTALLATPEANIAPAWARGLQAAEPEGTWPTRAFSGRLGRALATDYVRATAASDAPPMAPYPIQRALTTAMRAQATKQDNLSAMQAWAGQSAWMAKAEPADVLLRRWWSDASALF